MGLPLTNFYSSKLFPFPLVFGGEGSEEGEEKGKI